MHTHLEVVNDNTAWMEAPPQAGEKIFIPAKHGEGRYEASLETIKQLEDRAAFRYTDNYNGLG